MSANSYLTAVGKFNRAIVEYLDYPKEYYDEMRDGDEIVVDFPECNTTSQSRELAHWLQVSFDDFRTHKLNSSAIRAVFDPNKMPSSHAKEFFEDTGWSQRDVNKLLALIDVGFIVFFRPNF